MEQADRPERKHYEAEQQGIMKWLVIIVMPAVATLYAALAAVWAWPYADEVVTTITAVDTFLGAVLCISTAQYHKEAGNNG